MRIKQVLFLLAYITFSVNADSKNHRMVISFKSGEQLSFIVNDKPEVTFYEGNICVKTTKNSIDYLRSEIKNFHFEEITASVETIEYLGNGIITIFDLSGNIVASVKGGFTIAEKLLIDSFKPGMYLIKINNQQTIKYLKK